MPKEIVDLKVLVVDDSPINHKILIFSLQSAFQEIISAFHGEEGFEYYQSECPNLILMDINMPIMDGLECTRAIRSYEAQSVAASPVFILAITGDDDEENIKEYLAAGMDGYVSKPVNREELLSTIENLMKI